MDKEILNIIITSFLGIFYTFIPHSIHIKISPDWSLFNFHFPHQYHVFFGISMLILTFYLINKKYHILIKK
jgi:hypothetical protein